MKKALHIAKANIRKHKSAVVSLFAILMVISALSTVGLSVILGVMQDYEAGIERLHGLHSVFIMTKDMYKPSFEDIIRDYPSVTEYEIGEVIHVNQLRMTYGTDIEHKAMILNADTERMISAPVITEFDNSIPRETTVYLPAYAQNLGFTTGSPFTITYRNKPVHLTVAGFFEATEFSMSNGIGLKYFVADECFEELKSQMGSSVWITVRFQDPYDSTAFNEYFRSKIDVELSLFMEDSLVMDFSTISQNAIMPIMVITSIILVFAFIVVVISLLVTRFRVTNGIEDSMHAIGVMKASGYTSGQITASYLTEYGLIALPAAFLGVLLAIPAFSAIRLVLKGISGISWMLGANILAGLVTSLLTTTILLLMIFLSCRKIHKLPPVDALRGGVTANDFRRNHFPLHKGTGNVQTRLGLKNTMAYLRQYVMAGAVLAAVTFAIIMIAAMYQNFVMDNTALIKMIGVETSDVDLTVARHTDADVLSAELEQLSEVRKTSMLDMLGFQVEDHDAIVYVSNDYDRMETMSTHDGRFPKYDNEIAISKLFADRLGKKIGDIVKVEAHKLSQEYIICGFFSTASNGGTMGALTLEGYQRLEPNYRRSNIKVYLNEGVTFDGFSELLKANFGVVNVHMNKENERFASAKARAEEKIANYLEFYGIDSMEYAVIYNGEIILSGSSGAYQIEKITNFSEWLGAQIGVYGSVASLLTQVITLVSLGVIVLVLSMTVRHIVTKRHREIGILKSSGFTTKQLARQLAISFLPCTLLGVLAGCVGGVLSVNPAMTAMFSVSGVHNANVHIYPPAAAALAVLVLMFSFAVANISAIRIKHITVYELLSE